MDVNKPTIIFTTFWDALKIVSNGGFLCGKSVVRFLEGESSVLSIALAKPKGDKFYKIPKLDFFCPSWEMLKVYKKGRDWDVYTKQYRDILIKNKQMIAQWVDNLENRVYILCCWENTVEGAKCHRSLVYDALRLSKRTKDSANYLYRHGDKAVFHKEEQLFAILEYFENEQVEHGMNIRQMSNLPLETISSLINSGVPPSRELLQSTLEYSQEEIDQLFWELTDDL